jgi:AcrR family transcriptional regulator
LTTEAVPARGRRQERVQATRAALVELAGDLFATRGYAQTSMRDIEREGPVSMGAIYAHFKNKAELLVEAINDGIAHELEQTKPRRRTAASHPVDHVERLTQTAREFRKRRKLRTLLVQGAAAAQTDEDTRTRVRDAQLAHIEQWIAGYQANRQRLGIDPSVDIETAVKFTWAVELGLGVLEAYGMEPTSPKQWADIQNRMARSLCLAPEAP